MDFYRVFAKTLGWRPKQALQALFWHLTGKRVRAQNCLRHCAHNAPYAYSLWIDTVERSADLTDLTALRSGDFQDCPTISIVAPGSLRSDRAWRAAAAAIQRQCYPCWELLIPADAPQTATEGIDPARVRRLPVSGNAAQVLHDAAILSRGEYLLPLPPGATLPDAALLRYVERLKSEPGADILYGDHDHLDDEGRRSLPWFKPEWNAEMFLCQDYLTSAFIVRTDAVRRAEPGAPCLSWSNAAYSILLDISGRENARIVHIPHILAHLHGSLSGIDETEQRAELISRRLAPQDAHAVAAPNGLVRVDWPLPNDRPLVSVIIPTRDRADLLRVCVDSLTALTSWPSYEIIIVDNQSTEPETIALFEKLRESRANVTILPYPHDYNYSAINNFAASHARGDYLCLLNNDTEIIEPNWLDAMMRQAVRPSVGAVGAKLLYDDGSIQHAGVIIGMGDAAGHAHRFQKPGERGYFDQVEVTRFVSAVTAACLVVAKSKFDTVGGLDEDELHVAYNDVDLCLKLQRAGWLNVYEHAATLIHHESKSRGNDLSPQHLQRYLKELAVLQKRWNTVAKVDPSHHPRLDRSQETYVIHL